MTTLEIILSNAAGIVAVIGLLFTTVEFIIKAVREERWSALVELILKDMVVAEKAYKVGTDRKQYVLCLLDKHAQEVGYNLTDESIVRISNLIDSICKASEEIN